MTTSMDLSLNLTGTHVLITGGAGIIGRVVVDAFLAAGARVSSLDIAYDTVGPSLVHDETPAQRQRIRCDISAESSVREAFVAAVQKFGTVACCVALGGLDYSVLEHSESIADASFGQLQRVLEVNVAGTWLVAREWVRGLRAAKGNGEKLKNVGLVIVGSECGWFGERTNSDYAAGKSAVQVGLLLSLRADVVRIWEGARVNAIAPGAVDTARFKDECKDDPQQFWKEAQATTALRKPVPCESVAKSILYLASENFSGHVHGQVLNVDSGKQGKVIWTKEECI